MEWSTGINLDHQPASPFELPLYGNLFLLLATLSLHPENARNTAKPHVHRDKSTGGCYKKYQ